MQTTDRLTAVDLRDFSEAEHTAIRQAAILEGVPLSEYLRRLVKRTATRIVDPLAALPPPPRRRSSR